MGLLGKIEAAAEKTAASRGTATQRIGNLIESIAPMNCDATQH